MGLVLKGILKKAEGMEKKYLREKSEISVLVCYREKKNNSLEFSVIILRYLRYLRNVNLSYSKWILKLQNLLEKTYFFLYLRGCPKNGEGN